MYQVFDTAYESIENTMTSPLTSFDVTDSFNYLLYFIIGHVIITILVVFVFVLKRYCTKRIGSGKDTKRFSTVLADVFCYCRMDQNMVKALDVRTTYNCFTHAGFQPNQSEEGRIFGAMDILPSILAAVGFEIEGNRSGVGTYVPPNVLTLLMSLGIRMSTANGTSIRSVKRECIT